MLKLGLAVLVVCAVLAPVSAVAQPTYSERFRESVRLRGENQPEAALRVAEALARDFPDESGPQSLRAAALRALYRYVEALQAYEQALARAADGSNRAVILGNMSSVLRDVGRVPEAITRLTEAAAADPPRAARFHLLIAQAHLETGDLASARAAYQRAQSGIDDAERGAVAINPSNAGNVYGVASSAAYQLGLDAEAVQHARTAVQKLDTDARRLWLASLLVDTGRRADGDQLFATVNPAKVSAMSLAAHYVRIANYEAAARELARAAGALNTPDATANWRKDMQHRMPRDVWAPVRNLDWFTKLVGR